MAAPEGFSNEDYRTLNQLDRLDQGRPVPEIAYADAPSAARAEAGSLALRTARHRRLKRTLLNKVVDARRMRALGFCVSIRHAEFMAEQFEKHGIPARAVSANTPREEREQALRLLRPDYSPKARIVRPSGFDSGPIRRPSLRAHPGEP